MTWPKTWLKSLWSLSFFWVAKERLSHLNREFVVWNGPLSSLNWGCGAVGFGRPEKGVGPVCCLSKTQVLWMINQMMKGFASNTYPGMLVDFSALANMGFFLYFPWERNLVPHFACSCCCAGCPCGCCLGCCSGCGWGCWSVVAFVAQAGVAERVLLWVLFRADHQVQSISCESKHAV